MRIHSQVTFPLIKSYQNPAISIVLSTQRRANQRDEPAIISHNEMQYVYGKDYSEDFKQHAAHKRAQAEGETDLEKKEILLENAKLLEDTATRGLPDYMGGIELYREWAQPILHPQAVAMCHEPNEAEIAAEAAKLAQDPETIKKVRDMYRENQPDEEPVQEQLDGTYADLAKLKLLENGKHPLTELPPAFIKAIENDKIDVFRIGIDLKELPRVPHNRMLPTYIRFKDLETLRHKRNALVEPRVKHGWGPGGRLAMSDDLVCYIELSNRGRGVLFILEPELVRRALESRQYLTYKHMREFVEVDFPPDLPGTREEPLPAAQEASAPQAPVAKDAEPQPAAAASAAAEEEEAEEEDDDPDEDQYGKDDCAGEEPAFPLDNSVN